MRNVCRDSANGDTTTFGYDANGNLTLLRDPLLNETTWVYDYLDRAIEETNELNDTRFYKYDSANNLKEKIDRNGRKTTYDYDNLNRQTNEYWWNGTPSITRTFSYSYDAAGQLKTAGDGASASYEYDYDHVGRLESEKHSLSGFISSNDLVGPDVVLTRVFDAANRLITMIWLAASTRSIRCSTA